ncbi:MAG: hypothetical protein JXJ20_01540 [Anaerolineae bacterium]|nr:hypothetical protein [Anaerolineae bacterium]
MNNRAFWRAIHSLAHPLSIGAVLLLLLNDHVLRRAWPSWWTGKIGDAAWLIFAPFLLAAALAWLVPWWLSHHEAAVGGLAFGLAAAGFVLAKTMPAVHTLALRTLDALTGWDAVLHCDPSDLLALPALWIGWRIWRSTRSRGPVALSGGWIVLALGALATVGNSLPYNYGVACLYVNDAQMVAEIRDRYNDKVFISNNGGLNWRTIPRSEIGPGECSLPDQLVDPADARIVYRVHKGDALERSADGGLTWQREVDFSDATSEAQAFYYQVVRRDQGIITVRENPLDAEIDPLTGHVVLAMGQDGVLVRTEDGEWRWVAVGAYEHDDVALGTAYLLVFRELWLALLLVPLIVTTLAWLCLPGASASQAANLIWLGIAWLSWALTPILLPPDVYSEIDGYMRASSMKHWMSAFLVGVAVIQLPPLLSLRDSYERIRPILLILCAAGGTGAVLFMLPFALWAGDVIVRYRMASILALLLTAAVLAGGYGLLRRVDRDEHSA